MPFDLEAEIARRLRVAPESVGPVLNAVIQRIRQQVSHFGYARVAGLGTFRGHTDHLAFEPEPVLADEVNARFGGLEDVVVAPPRAADEHEDVDPFDVPTEEDDHPVDVPSEEDDTLYGPSPGDDYERGDAGIDDGDEGEDAEDENVERAEDISDAHASINPVYEEPPSVPSAEYDRGISATDADRMDTWSEEIEIDDGVDEPAYQDDGIGLPPSEYEDETVDTDESSPAFAWRDQEEAVDDDEAGVEPPEEGQLGGFGKDDSEPDGMEPYWMGEEEEEEEEELAELEPEVGHPLVEWNPTDEPSDGDSYAGEEEDAAITGAFGGAAVDAGGDEEDLHGDEVFTEAERVYDDETSDFSDETAGLVGEEAERVNAIDRAPDRDALLHEGAHEPSDRRRATASAAEGDSIAGRRSVVLISIGIVVLLAAAGVIYLATSTSPVEETAAPGIAETPTAQDTSAAVASGGSGAAAADTTDLAAAAPPADPSPGSPPAAETPLDPLRGTEAIDRAAGGYTLVVFSEVSETSANTVATTYRDQDFRTVVLDDQDGGQTRFRVGVGQFPTLDEAVEARDRLAGNGLPDDAWVRRIQ